MARHDISEICELVPRLDCGLCSNASCITFARKIAVCDQKPKECMYISKPNLERIENIIEEGVEVSASGVIRTDEGLTYIHPCTEAGHVTAEAQLVAGIERKTNLKYGFFDPYQVCTALNFVTFFEDVRCSPELGYGLVNYEGKRVHIFKSGKINVRKAKNKNDAISTLRILSRVLWGAVICSRCAASGVDCASGGCEECSREPCPVLFEGPPSEARGGSIPQKSSGEEIFYRVEKLSTHNIFREGMTKLDELVVILGEFDSIILSRKEFDRKECRGRIEPLLKEVNKLSTKFIIETERKEDAALGLVLAGLGLNLKRMTEGFLSLDTDIDIKLYTQAKEIAFEAYKAFKNGDKLKITDLTANYQHFMKNWLKNQKHLGIEIIATNGFYISRILSQPLPR